MKSVTHVTEVSCEVYRRVATRRRRASGVDGAGSIWEHGPVSTASDREWLTLPQVAEAIGLSAGKVGRLVQEHHLLARRIDGEPRVPKDFIVNGEPLVGLRGTVILLLDGGLREDEVLDWLLEEEETLGAAPVDALRQGRKTQVRHSVQLLGL